MLLAMQLELGAESEIRPLTPIRRDVCKALGGARIFAEGCGRHLERAENKHRP